MTEHPSMYESDTDEPQTDGDVQETDVKTSEPDAQRKGGARRKRAGKEGDGSATVKPTRKEAKVEKMWTDLFLKHRNQMDEWIAIIVTRVRENKEDEQRGVQHRWGTSRVEEVKVADALGEEYASLRWKLWLEVDSKDDTSRCWEKFLALIADFCLPEQMTLFCHGYHTCHAESFHSSRTALTSKDASYWASFQARSEMAVLKWNLGYSYITRVAELMQIQLTEEEIATLRRMDGSKDREAHRRQTPERKKKEAVAAKEGEMRTAKQHVLNNIAQKERDKKRKLDRKAAASSSAATKVSRLSAPTSAAADVQEAAELLTTWTPFTTASSAANTQWQSSASSQPVTPVRRNASLQYKSPTEKLLPFRSSVEERESTMEESVSEHTRHRRSTRKRTLSVKGKENADPDANGKEEMSESGKRVKTTATGSQLRRGLTDLLNKAL